MRKISTLALVAAIATCIGFQSAAAGLLGMPLNLRATIEQINLGTVSTNSCRGFTDDVFIGPLPINLC
jgi:hypothetical protein